MSSNAFSYGTIVEYKSRVYEVIDTFFEDNERRAVLEFAEDEYLRGELPNIIIAPVADLEIVKKKEQINKARTRSRNASAK